MWQQVIYDIVQYGDIQLVDIAKALGISKGTLSRIKNGETQRPQSRIAIKLISFHAKIMADREPGGPVLH